MEKNKEYTMQKNNNVNELIDGLTLFDDDLMSRVFDKKNLYFVLFLIKILRLSVLMDKMS